MKVKVCQTFTIAKNWYSQNLLKKKIWRNAVALKSKKVQYTFAETFNLGLMSSAALRLQNGASGFF